MDTDLQTHLKASPSEAKMVTLKFRVFDAHGRLVRVDFPDWPGRVGQSQFRDWGLGFTFNTPPTTTTSSAKPGKAELISEFVYPTAFDFPDLTASTDNKRKPITSAEPSDQKKIAGQTLVATFPVTPTTPTAFATKNTGWTIDNITVEAKAAFLVVQGRFVETVFDGFIDCAGEAFSPIMTPATSALGRPTTLILTDNKVQQPTFTTRETPFVVSALPGEAYRVRLNVKEPGWFLEIRAK